VPSTSGNVERALLAAAKAGDEAAVEELFSRHQDDVYRFARRLTWPDANLAEDISQQAMLVALEKLGTFREHSSFRTWLLGIVVNVSRNRQRSERKRHAREAASAHDMDSIAGQADALAEAEQLGQIIETAFSRLPAGQQEALYLREISGLTYDEIAVALGISVNAVKNRIHNGRRTMQGLISGSLGGSYGVSTDE